jgi:hypothetical protein
MEMGDLVETSIPGGVPGGLVQNLWDQMQRFWIEPELERRRTTGTLPPDFSYGAVQVLIDGLRGSVE